MRRKDRRIWALLLGLGLFLGAAACEEAPPPTKQKTFKERITPRADISLAEQMEIAQANFDFMLYGFINYDITQIEQAAENLTTLARQWASRVPKKIEADESEWSDLASQQENFAQEARRLFALKQFDEANVAFTNLLKNCMDCHIAYLKR